MCIRDRLKSVDSTDVSRVRGFVDPPFELKHRYLQLAPGELVPFIRRRCRLAHDVFTLLGSSPCRSTARLSAYPPAFPEALASDVIPPRAPCGWHLLRRIDRPRRGRTGLLRSRFGFGDGRRVGKLRRDPCGVNAGRAENRRPKVRCHFGSSVSASCAGSTYRRFHSLPVRTRIHLSWRYHRVRLPVAPRSCPRRGLMARSLPRGMCVSPSPGAVGIAPTPETSSQAVQSCLLFTWGPILRAERSVSGQRIALPLGCWGARRRGGRERPRANPSPAAGGGQTALPHLRRHDTG